MPELPEVEAARRAIADHCVGKKITRSVVADDSKVIDVVSPSDFQASLLGKTIVAAHRKGKNMWLQLDSPPFLSFQFGMAGAIYIKGVTVTKYKREEVSTSPGQNGKILPPLPDQRPCHLPSQPLNGDGIQSVAQFRKEALFDDYRISSQNDDHIAFAIDLSLLHRALRSIITIYTEFSASHGTVTSAPTTNRLQIKLVKKLPPHSQQPMPFLTFETKGYKSAVIQDVPISKPLNFAL